MGAFSLVHHAIWEDAHVRRLDGDSFRLFVFSFTNGTCASLTGFTEASSRKLRRAVWPHDPTVSEDRLAVVLEALSTKPLVLYDWDAELLLCVERPRYSIQNPNQAKSAVKWLNELPASPLIEQYRERYVALFGQPSTQRLRQPPANGSANTIDVDAKTPSRQAR